MLRVPDRRTVGLTRRGAVSLVLAPLVFAVAACSGAPAAVPSQPTVQAAATQVSAAASPVIATAQAVASPAAATVQAAASPLATSAAQAVGTAVAAASPVATAIASAVASPSPRAESPIRVVSVGLAGGTPSMTLQNTGTTAVDVSGWQLRVGSGVVTLPANTRMGPSQTLTLHAADGTSSGSDVYLGPSAAALFTAASPGAAVMIVDQQGRVVGETSIPRA